MRAATLVADDTVEMYFLRDGGKAANDTDWQMASTGSPGQRTAAMLGFVLNHGTEPLILDQPEDDLDASLITSLILSELRRIRWTRQVIVMNNDGRTISSSRLALSRWVTCGKTFRRSSKVAAQPSSPENAATKTTSTPTMKHSCRCAPRPVRHKSNRDVSPLNRTGFCPRQLTSRKSSAPPFACASAVPR